MSLTQSSPLSTTMMSSVIGLQQSPKFFQSSGGPLGGGGGGPPRFQSSFQKSNHHHHHHHHHQHHHQHQVLNATQFRPLAPSTQQGGEFDGKRLRKAVTRRTIDYNAAVVRQIQLRVWQRDRRDHRAIQPDYSYYPEMVPPPFFVHNPINAVTTKFVRTSTNKMRCPIFCVAWTPEGRRLVTGASSGEFTLWNGLTFNFETILQAHDSPVRCMVWSHTDQWMVTGDHAGFVKYWQSNMNNVKMFQAHKEPLRGISFCPTDTKFATCSDDGTVRIWDFLRCNEEKILRGHGADVKCVAWHPQKALLVSGSKDSQQPIKLWDPKSGQSLATLHAHKSTVMEAKWNDNGNWLLTGSRDHLIKLFDIRKLSQEVQTFRGHKKEVSSLAWHPMHESLFASGGSDGALMFWLTGVDKEVGSMEQAHDSIVWSLDWHPLGHILCSGSNDHTCKFWTRNRPGDKMRDKYNLNMMPIGGSMDDNSEYDDISMAPSIPGMGLEQLNHVKTIEQIEEEMLAAAIPGLDFGSEEPQMSIDHRSNMQKKIPYSKPIPRQFQQQWMDSKPMLSAPPPPDGPMKSVGDTQNSVSSLNPAMIPLPPQHVVHNVPPPPVPSQQAFANRAMMGPGGDLTQGPPPPIRMPMMWSARPPGMSDGQMRSSFPPIGNGSPFALPPPTISGGSGSSGGGFSDMMANKGSGQEKAASKNWKEFGDSDFRVQTMDSDLRMLNNKPMPSEHRVESVCGDVGDSKHGPSLPPSHAGGDDQDRDMRTQLRDMDARVPHEFGGGGGSLSASQNNNDGRSDGSNDGGTRRGRWGSFIGRVRDSGTSFSNQPTFGKGDLDERLLPSSQEGCGGSGTMPKPQPNFSQPPPPARKRGWDVGPGMVDLNSQNHRDGGGGGGSNQQKPPVGLPPLPPASSSSSLSSSSSSLSSSQGIGVGQRDPPPHMQRGDDQGMRIGDGRQRFIPPPPPIPGRGIPPWGGPMRMRGPPPGSQGGGGGGGWFRGGGGGGPFRSGPPPPPNRGRMGMRGPFTS